MAFIIGVGIKSRTEIIPVQYAVVNNGTVEFTTEEKSATKFGNREESESFIKSQPVLNEKKIDWNEIERARSCEFAFTKYIN